VILTPRVGKTVAGDPPSDEPVEVFRKGALMPDTPGLVQPKVVQQVDPTYTTEAIQRKIQGQVELEAIVLPDGSVGKVRIVRSLDKAYGLDQEAVNALRKWKFVAGTLDGKAVAVVADLVLTFKLRQF